MSLEHQLAGLLATIDIVPAHHHPETMLPWARHILDLIDGYQPDDAGHGATINEILRDPAPCTCHTCASTTQPLTINDD